MRSRSEAVEEGPGSPPPTLYGKLDKRHFR